MKNHLVAGFKMGKINAIASLANEGVITSLLNML
jgi:hypothetical protein